AHCYFQLRGWRGLLIYDTAIRGKQALDKALELDPDEVQAIVVLGNFKQMAYLDMDGAEASYRRALELDPANANALYEYGLFLSRTGRPDEALSKMERAQELDPLSTLPLYGFGWIYYFNRQHSKAQEYYQAVLELQPGFLMFWPRRNELALLMQQSRYAEAAAEAEEWYAKAAFEREKEEALFLQLRAEWALANSEKVYSVRDSLRSTGELQKAEQEYPYWSARFYAIMGEREKALSLLEKASENPLKEIYLDGWLVYNPEFDFLRAEPRFKALLEKLGLTEVFDQYGERIR
ncbi:MAG: tetratricopeptide repeat protein, partial [Fidelibacterota bacterium]